MVLSSSAEGAGNGRALRVASATAPVTAGRLDDEHGSQSVEFALTIPFVVLALVLLLHAALFGADLVAANAVALQAARVASIADDEAVAAAVRDAAGDRPVEVSVDPPDHRRGAGDLVAATVRLRSAAFAAFGGTVDIPARVTFRTERP